MLIGVIIAWDHELLRQCVDNFLKSVDKVVLVWSNESNYGNKLQFPVDQFKDCVLVQHEPDRALIPHKNEQNKRNIGLEKAKQIGGEYVIIADCDEFYEPEDVRFWYEYLRHSNHEGLVCRSHVYFGSPTLSIGEDVTFVPFIHKLRQSLKLVFTQDYPFTRHEGKLRIDPTRRFNLTENVKLIGCICYHFSWYRKDYSEKIENSSAGSLRDKKAEIMADIANAKDGYFVKSIYQKTLFETKNIFNL